MNKEQVNHEIDQALRDPVDRLLEDKKPASSGKGLAVLALLLALAAIAVGGWQWWQAYSRTQTNDPVQASVADLVTQQQAFSQSLGKLRQQLDAQKARVDPAEFSRLQEGARALEAQLARLQRESAGEKATNAALQGSVRSLEQRQSLTEAGLASVAANSQNAGMELDIAEIDYLLRIASERLQLFSDPQAAELALQAADVQLEALRDPLFLSVRQRIADARSALAAVPAVDRVKLSARITGLQNSIPGLSFSGDAGLRTKQAAQPADAGWWASFKHSLASLVTVKRRVSEDRELLTIADKDYLRQGIWMQLESARLALMRHDASTYQASLERVGATLEQFFHNGAGKVAMMQKAVTNLLGVDIAPAMPDISPPWLQLRQLRDSRRLLKSAPPPADGEDVE